VKRDRLQSGHALTAETHRQPRLREIDTDSRVALSIYGIHFYKKDITTLTK